jgi:uncharacterized protein YciI
MEFIYITTPNKENFAETMTGEEAKIMGIHFNYLKEMLAEGKLVMAGPEINGKFGITVIETETEDEARMFMENDPAVKNGVVSGKLYPYRVSLLRGRD